MPSWNDGETSSDSLLSEFETAADLSPVPRVPESTFDPDFTGIETAPASDGRPMRCYRHDLELHKFVAFQGTNTGRRFLGCGSKDNATCETVHWVDEEWPRTLKNSLLKVWKLYDDEKETRMSGNVEYATANYQLVLDKRELERKNIQLHKQLGNTVTEEEVAKITADLEHEKIQRQMAEKQISTLKEEKTKLEFYIAELLNAGEKNKKKIKNISEICAE